jgi:hypothetical protein
MIDEGSIDIIVITMTIFTLANESHVPAAEFSQQVMKSKI